MSFENCSTLIEMLASRAELTGEKPAFTFNGVACTFASLWGGIIRFAAFLQQQELHRYDRIVIALPNSAEFFIAFYGVQRAGGIAVPVFPGSSPERISSLANLCGSKLIIVPSALPVRQLENLRSLAAERGLRIVRVVESETTSSNATFPDILPEDVAFFQYTSGSTGNPKGVILTHANLLTNIRQMIKGMEITERDIFVSWLPVYHDMGLILKTMVPFYLAADVHLLPTNLRDVGAWLEAIQRHRATFTAAPDFAYRLCLRHTDPKSLDLSSLRVALNAAEPVRESTIHEFEQAFHLKNVMVAGYGLAEATVGVSMWKPGSKARIDTRGRVSVGRPFPDVEVRIRRDDQLLETGETGEIAIRSKANSQGYFNNPEETSKLFWKDGYILSGDLGYLDENGCLFIVSRIKNIIKRFGETISPQEIEEFMDALRSVRFSAAVGIAKDGLEGEQVYVFAELRDDQSRAVEELHELTLQIVEAFHLHMGFRPARVYLLKPHSIPLTHNGKIQHGRLKELYHDHSLRQRGQILYPDY
jgi:acyl-CoA synthetase (AMP-forming)/AMP-acid ligase II